MRMLCFSRPVRGAGPESFANRCKLHQSKVDATSAVWTQLLQGSFSYSYILWIYSTVGDPYRVVEIKMLRSQWALVHAASYD